jgi:branched-chain amino acid transport system substrate-binding protein
MQMKSKVRRFFGLALVFCMMMTVFTACGNSGSPSGSEQTPAAAATESNDAAVSSGYDKTLKIGIIGPGSGNYAWVKDYFCDSVQLAIDEMEAIGPEATNGVKLEWIFEDDSGDPTSSVTGTIKLIEEEKVDIIFGPFNSSCAYAQIGEAAKHEIPEIIFALSNGLTEQGNEWVFRCSPADGVTVRNVMQYAYDEMGARKFAFLTDSTDYGTSAYVEGEPFLKDLGLEPLTNEKFDIPDKDFTAQLLKIKNADPDVLVLHGDEADCGLIAKQRLQLGMGDLQLIGGIPMTGVKFLENAGKDGSEGCVVTTNFLANRDDPKVKQFVTNFEEKYNYTPEARCASLYDATYVLAEALKNSGGAIDNVSLRDGIRAVQNYEGVQGTFKYDEAGNGLNVVMKAIFEDGEMQFLGW